MTHSTCPGCKALLPDTDGPVHSYMTSTPACYACFNEILAAEYGNATLLQTHRLTVDAYAVQHPGAQIARREIQSVGLHLARLWLQLDHPRPPKETNDVMLAFSAHKHTLDPLPQPARFTVTASDVSPFAGTDQHAAKVTHWARATWQDWAGSHAYIQAWATKYL